MFTFSADLHTGLSECSLRLPLQVPHRSRCVRKSPVNTGPHTKGPHCHRVPKELLGREKVGPTSPDSSWEPVFPVSSCLTEVSLYPHV